MHTHAYQLTSWRKAILNLCTGQVSLHCLKLPAYTKSVNRTINLFKIRKYYYIATLKLTKLYIFAITNSISSKKEWNLNKNTPGVNKEQPKTKKALLKKMWNQNWWLRSIAYDRNKIFDHHDLCFAAWSSLSKILIPSTLGDLEHPNNNV